MNELLLNKSPIRAAQNKQSQFDMPALHGPMLRTHGLKVSLIHRLELLGLFPKILPT